MLAPSRSSFLSQGRESCQEGEELLAQGRNLCSGSVLMWNLKPKVSKFLKIMPRGSVGHDVLFRWYPKCCDLDIENRRDQ